VLFAEPRLPFTLSSEQFWGRAARASVTRKSPGARYLLRYLFCHSLHLKEEGDAEASPFSLCAEHVRQLGGESPLPNLVEVKG